MLCTCSVLVVTNRERSYCTCLNAAQYSTRVHVHVYIHVRFVLLYKMNKYMFVHVHVCTHYMHMSHIRLI